MLHERRMCISWRVMRLRVASVSPDCPPWRRRYAMRFMGRRGSGFGSYRCRRLDWFKERDEGFNAGDAEFAEAQRNLKTTSWQAGAQQCCALTFLYAIFAAVAGVGLVFAPEAFAQRKPVLEQIKLPHPYYYREMYLPQLT